MRLGDAAADQYAARRRGQHEGMQQLPQRMRDQIPHRTVGRNEIGRHAGTRRDGHARCQPFDTVAMKRTAAPPGIARLAHDTNVSELGMTEPVNRIPADDQPDTHAGAHGNVGEIRKTDGRSPAPLCQRGAVHVRIEAHGNAERACEATGNGRIPPAGFRRRGDRSVAWRPTVEIDRPERRDAESRHGTMRVLPIPQHALDPSQRRLRVAPGRDRYLLANVVGSGAEETDALGPAELHCAEQRFVRRHRAAVPGWSRSCEGAPRTAKAACAFGIVSRARRCSNVTLPIA